MKPPLKQNRLHGFCFWWGWPVGVAGGGWREILPVEKRGGGRHIRNCLFLDFHSTKQGLLLVDCGVTEGGKTLLVFFFVNEHNTNMKPQAKKQRV